MYKEFTDQKRCDVPLKWNLGPPIIMEKNTKYTIEILQQNDADTKSAYCVDGKDKVTSDGLTISFSNASNSPNGTGVKHGALPTLYFSRI